MDRWPRGVAALGRSVRRMTQVIDVRRHRTDVDRPALGEHERILIHESMADGEEYVGTNCALYLRSATRTDVAWHRVGWAEVSAVEWARTTRTMTLQLWPDKDRARASLRLVVKDRSRVPEFTTERTAACLITTRHVSVSTACTATVRAQRDPECGEIAWRVHLEGACDHDDPVLGAAIDDTLAELATQLGC
ncbi:MAG: hypothetical protein WKF83_13470 [Nocardioidaceae bacterium]